MGWKGTVRSLQAASNQAKRDAQRRQREYDRQQAQLSKMAELERAAAEVRMYDDYIRSLETVHGRPVPEVDWRAVATAERPEPPSRSSEREAKAQKDVDDFKPKVLESKKRQAARLEQLQAVVVAARGKDDAEYQSALSQHEMDTEAWEGDKELAAKVLDGDIKGMAEASRQIEDLNAAEYVQSIEFIFSDDQPARAAIGIAPLEEVVPDKKKALLASGKLSVKQMPKGEYFGLYQDCVCGSALLVANAVLGLLPIPELVVNAQTEMLNTATGLSKGP